MIRPQLPNVVGLAVRFHVNQIQCDISKAPDQVLSVSDARARLVQNHGIGGRPIRTCTCEPVNYYYSS